MRKIFYLLVIAFISFSSVHSFAHGIDSYNLKNYVYDDEGNPIFIKVYIESPKVGSSNQHKSRNSLHQDSIQQILQRMAQDDQQGSYVVIPIKKKIKELDDEDDADKDESVWECPYCGTINPSYRNTCKRKGCILYR